MVYGYVSGGIASEATGGNFLMGAATGAIVSLANHGLHGDGNSRSKIDKFLRETGGYTEEQIKGTANLSDEQLLDLAKKFTTMYNKKQPSVAFANKNNTDIVEILDSGEKRMAGWTSDNGKSILINPTENNYSLRSLAIYVGHELYHSAYDIKYYLNGQRYIYTKSLNEYNAYKYSQLLDGPNTWTIQINKVYNIMQENKK